MSVPSESLARNELKEAENVEFSSSTGAMTVRGGLRTVAGFDYDIYCVCPLHEWNAAIVVQSNSTHNIRAAELVKFSEGPSIKSLNIGFTDLEYKVQAVLFDDSYIITNGRALYRLIGSTATEIPTNFPLPEGKTMQMARLPFVRNGRVGIVSYDEIYFSAVGDCTDWTITSENAGLNDAPKKIEIGYKDGLDMTAITPLSTDLIIFKSSPGEDSVGKIYRMTGSYPDWAVLEAANGTGTFSHQTIQTVGNDIYYLSRSGLETLSTVTEYGGIKTFQPDRKVNRKLITLLDSTAQIWNIPEKQQLWISPSSQRGAVDTVWVFDYVRNIWTTYKFPTREGEDPSSPSCVCCINNVVYVFIRNKMYVLDESRTYDSIRNSDEKRTVTGYMKLGKLSAGRQILVKGAYAEHDIKDGCSGELVLGNFRMPFSGKSSRRQFMVRDWSVTPEIYLRGGGCSLSVMGLETVEV